MSNTAQDGKKRPKSKLVFIAALGGSLLFVSPEIYDFLGKWESSGKMVLTVYADKIAKEKGLPTVCRGLTHHVTDTPIVVGEVWTERQCIEEEGKAIEKVQNQLVKCFTRLPPQGVFDMATSHAWNFGASATCSSGFMQQFNAGNWQAGCRRIAYHLDGRPAWSYSGGTFYRGLHNRRKDEYLNCLRAVQEQQQ